jgi:hypothetical protein
VCDEYIGTELVFEPARDGVRLVHGQFYAAHYACERARDGTVALLASMYSTAVISVETASGSWEALTYGMDASAREIYNEFALTDQQRAVVRGIRRMIESRPPAAREPSRPPAQ